MLTPVRIGVLVSGGGTNLQALLNAGQSGALHSGEIALVLSSKADAYALRRAEQAGVPSAVVERRGKSAAAFEAELLQKLREYNIELVILAGFMTILSADFIAAYRDRILNVHPSLIPSFCGAGYYGLRVHRAALDYGVKVTGATVHLVNEIPDGGRILLQKAVEVLPGDTPESLQKRVMEQAEWVLLPQAAEQLSAELLANQNAKRGERV